MKVLVGAVTVVVLALLLLFIPGSEGPSVGTAPVVEEAAPPPPPPGATEAGLARPCPTCITEGGCTDIVVGKKASTDGAVMTSHTADCWYDSRLQIMPAQDHKPGTMAPVYEWIIYEDRMPLVKLGEIPQVAHTYKWFKVGYPFANEHQVMIGETTLGGHPKTKNSERAIMTIEQLEAFCLQRAKNARECIQIMGDLAVKYGFRESCFLGEALTVTDPNEAWVFEVFGTGPTWTPGSGKPGAVWAAQRIPDDHIAVVPNMSRIARINTNDKANFMFSSNYMQTAIDLGIYDPKSGKPFIWRDNYGDIHNYPWKDGAVTRLWRVFTTLAPSGKWEFAKAPDYPISVKPDKKVSLQQVVNLFRDTMEGTPYDMTAQPGWMVETEGGKVKSPLATPQLDKAWAELLNIKSYRPIARYYCSYFFISQARAGMPNDIGGVLWFGLDNPQNSPYIPVFMGIESVPESWKRLDRTRLDRTSAWWAFALVDDLVNHYYGVLKPEVDKVLLPMQAHIFASQPAIEKQALEIYKRDPKAARAFLTNYTSSLMLSAEKAYWDLADQLLFALNNNRPDCGGYLYERYQEQLKTKK
ncbi:MAG: C69 family dipeptidase [Armatimonadota bacterium]|nr:C69 family dipeptidase [Armatimonadota bacterium]